MDDKSQYKVSLRLAKRALDYIAEYGTPPTPRAFEVFYTLCSGLNPKLSEAVASIAARSGKVSSADAERLYEQYIAQTAAPSQMMAISSKMSAEMSGLLSLINIVAQNTSSYQSSLQNAEEHLSNGNDSMLMTQMVKELLAATQKIAKANAEVSSNIETSRAQVEQLDDCLKAVREETSKDGQTGLSNRKHVDLVLDESLLKVGAEDMPLCLMMIEIDNFREFVEKFGDIAADSALRYVASCIKSNINSVETAGRYNAENFAIVLPDTEMEHALSLAERIRHLVNSRSLVRKVTGESMGRISLSIGVTECDAEEAPEQCYGRAEACMHAARDAGGNRASTTPIDDAPAMAATA